MDPSCHHFTLSVVRHGETDANCQAIIQGQADTTLNSLGRLQAQQLAQSLPADSFDLVYSSDLSRAYETCQILVDGIANGESKAKLPIRAESRIRERSFGSLQGQSLTVLRKMANDAGKTIVDYNPPDGETLEQVRARAVEFIEDRLLAEVTPGQRVLLVAHGGVIREIIAYFASFGHDSLKRSKALLIPPNTSLNQFRITYQTKPQPARATISQVECLSLHDISHLNAEIQQKALNQKQINEGVSV